VATETIQVSTFIPAPPMRVYAAWLSSTEHTAMTGGVAVVDPKVGGKFTAWDGYIEGANRELIEGRRVVQSWRTNEFPKDAPDSLLTVNFDPDGKGTRLTLLHSDIPEGQGRGYEGGWVEYYVEPMVKYFDATEPEPAPKKAEPKKKPAAKKKAAPKKAPAKKKPAAKKPVAKKAKPAKAKK